MNKKIREKCPWKVYALDGETWICAGTDNSCTEKGCAVIYFANIIVKTLRKKD